MRRWVDNPTIKGIHESSEEFDAHVRSVLGTDLFVHHKSLEPPENLIEEIAC